MDNNTFSSISFNSLEKQVWLENISSIQNNYSASHYKPNILLRFDEKLDVSELYPMHLVTLACLIQFFRDLNHKIFLAGSNDSFRNLIFDQLNFKEYFSGGKNHVNSKQITDFNFWRVVEPEKDLYAKNVEQYFKNTDFKGKDLSAISLSMVEAFYNIFDHAEANNNAFSLIKYNKSAEALEIAICDLGKGISKSVREHNDKIEHDTDALLKAVEYGFTVQSKNHNRGLGLDTIIACSEDIHIFCNQALLQGKEKSVHKVPFHFSGTLIYFKILISSFENEEVIDSFEM